MLTWGWGPVVSTVQVPKLLICSVTKQQLLGWQVTRWLALMVNGSETEHQQVLLAQEQQWQGSSAVLYWASSRGCQPAQPTPIRPACPIPRWFWCLWLSHERPQKSKASCWLCTTPCWERRRWGNVFHPLWWHTRGTPWKQRLLWPLESQWGRTACAKRLLNYPTWGWLPNPKLIICNSGVEARGCQLPNDSFSPLGTLWSSWGGLHLPPHKRSELTMDQAECVSPSPGTPPRLQHDPQLWVTSFLTNPDAVQSRQLLICANAENLLRQSEFGLQWFLLCMWPFWLLLVFLSRASLCNCFPKHWLAAVLGRRDEKSHGTLQCQGTSDRQVLTMQWGFPWIHFWRECLAVCPSPAGCNQYFILGTDVVGVSAPSMHQCRWVGSATRDHCAWSSWQSPVGSIKAWGEDRLLSRLPTLYPPSDMCMHSELAGSHLQARESNFESNTSTTFGISFAVSIQIPAPGLEAWAVPGLSQVQAECQGHQAATGLRPRSCHLCWLGCTEKWISTTVMQSHERADSSWEGYEDAGFEERQLQSLVPALCLFSHLRASSTFKGGITSPKLCVLLWFVCFHSSGAVFLLCRLV